LGRKTWFHLGGRARYYFQPDGEEDLAAMTVRAKTEGVPLRVLGEGANILVSDDGFDGVVVRLDGPSFRSVKEKPDGIEVGAGVDLMPLARTCSARGWSGLECLAGIPATIGGAVRTNAGGRFGEIGDVVRSVRVMDQDGRIETWPRERLGFGYRRSAIGDRIVLSADLALVRDDPDRTRAKFEEVFEYKLQSQPMADKSAGCIFKNPQGGSAGAMIDRAGLKGVRSGGARVSERHANFIVADKGASASDVLNLIDVVRNRVRDAFDTELELEIHVWKPVGTGRGAA